MSSNMSDRRLDPPDPDDWLEEPPAVPPLDPPEESDPVEYFVDVLELDDFVFTSVPKSVQFEQTSSFAPSTLTVFGDDVSAPHISH